MASDKKREKKQGMNMMNWQSEQARKKMESERPEIVVRENNMLLNAMEVVKFLRSERNGEKEERLGKWTYKSTQGEEYRRNTDFLSIAQVKERTNVDIANDTYRGFQGLRYELEQRPNIEWAGSDRLRYKVRGQRALRFAVPERAGALCLALFQPSRSNRMLHSALLSSASPAYTLSAAAGVRRNPPYRAASGTRHEVRVRDQAQTTARLLC